MSHERENGVNASDAQAGGGGTEAGHSAPPSPQPPFPSQDPPPRSRKAEIWKGVGLGTLLHLLPWLFPVLYFGIGIVQFLYLIPAMIFLRNRPGMVQGLLIVLGVTFLLNAACFGYVFIALN
ncbi:hypothetical protein ACFFK0_04965 [Paenibacillus chartarius]|uniref:DUF4190 domain-containing protein n=1 Tax=Paenibacillus chartarius TaxID=747481 RepID=A0ABV6DGP3_9BACL